MTSPNSSSAMKSSWTTLILLSCVLLLAPPARRSPLEPAPAAIRPGTLTPANCEAVIGQLTDDDDWYEQLINPILTTQEEIATRAGLYTQVDDCLSEEAETLSDEWLQIKTLIEYFLLFSEGAISPVTNPALTLTDLRQSDDPAIVQIRDEAGIPPPPGYICLGILRGDFGYSFRNRKLVLDEIAARLANTIYLMSVTLLVALVIAVPIGVISAIKQYSWFDISVTTFSFAGQAMPDFWLGLILIIIFYVLLKNPVTGEPLLPVGGIYTTGMGFSITDRLAHLVMPVTAGSLGWSAWYSRFLRSSMLDVIHQDYLRTARAKGLTLSRVMFKHALPNAIIPLVTLLALDLPYVIGGAVSIVFG